MELEQDTWFMLGLEYPEGIGPGVGWYSDSARIRLGNDLDRIGLGYDLERGKTELR